MRFPSSLLVALMAAIPFTLQAANPRIGVDNDPPNPTILTSTSFGFGADANGGGDLPFQNESGLGWNELTVTTVLSNQISTPICVSGPFFTCTVSGVPQGSNIDYTIIFGPADHFVIPQREIFTINLNDQGTNPIGLGSWPAGQDFSATANTPEPASLTLLLAGGLLAAGVALYRRRPSATV